MNTFLCPFGVLKSFIQLKSNNFLMIKNHLCNLVYTLEVSLISPSPLLAFYDKILTT